MCWPPGPGRANAITSRLIASRHSPTFPPGKVVGGRRLLPFLFRAEKVTRYSRSSGLHSFGLSRLEGRAAGKEWPREMRKQIEFSKTIARLGAGHLCGLLFAGRTMEDLPAADRPELIVRKSDLRQEVAKERLKKRPSGN